MTAIQSTSLSPYLSILEDEISQDLRATIKPEELRAEVRKTLFREVLRQGATAVAELDSAFTYFSSDEKKIIVAEQKLGRHLGYIQEMLGHRAAQRIDPNHQLNAGQPEEEL